MTDFEECKDCEMKHIDEFCAKCNGSSYSTLYEHYCSSCHGSVESACRHIRQKGDYCIDDGASIRFFEEHWKRTD